MPNLARRSMRRYRLAAGGLLLLAGAAMVAAPAPVQLLRNAVFDSYQRLFPRERREAPAIIVEIDEKSLAAMGQWPWPRTRVADLIDRIQLHRPAVIGIDLLFSEPDRFSPARLAEALPVMPTEMAEKLVALPTTDHLLAQAFARSNVVLGVAGMPAVDARFPYPPRAAPMDWQTQRPMDRLLRYAGHLQSLPELERAARGRGLISNDAPDGVVRRALLLARVGESIVPSLGLDMLRVASGGNIAIVDRRFGGFGVSLAGLEIPLQADGTVWLRTARHDPHRFVSALDVLNGKVDGTRIANKLVLIGITGLGLQDFRLTALGENVPGVEIHAQLIEQLFEDRDLSRPRAMLWLEVALLLAGGVAVIAWSPRFRVQRVWAAASAAFLIVVLGGLGSFLWAGVLVDGAWIGLGWFGALAIMQAGTLAASDRMQRELRETAARMEGELDAGKRIQMGLLPNPSNLFGGDQRFAIAAALTPARTVGGDFYECFWLDSHRVFFAVADVSGKGLPAALFMAASKSHLKSAVLLSNGNLPAMLGAMESELARENPEQLFITFFAAVLDVLSGTLTTINAGHDAPLLARADGTLTALERASGPPLGVTEGFAYTAETRTLARGDKLLVFTDGVTEAVDARGAFFGAERMRDVFAKSCAGKPYEIVQAMDDAVKQFSAGTEAADDVTLLCLEWRE
ncbi:MAG: CHASE2 domain-containing protein [Betaproteobacteria bacterium]|nr:CHASE2 domain-containing protein [Betaproteobacteria bacterium]